MASLLIGEVVRLTGKTASTIRYYEEIGLIPPPERVSGRRRYQPDIVRVLSVIATAQRAGLRLDEIRLLLDASSADRLASERLREVARRKLPQLSEAIARAELVRGWLEDAARCRCPTLDDCPLFEDSLLPDPAEARPDARATGEGPRAWPPPVAKSQALQPAGSAFWMYAWLDVGTPR